MRAFAYLMALAVLLAPDPVVPATVAPCLVVGDSIAVGLSEYRPQCRVVAKEGASSAQISRFAPAGKFGRVYISAGSNDPLNPKLGANLFTIRRKYETAEVTWVAPRNSRAAERVYETALYFKDRIVYLSKFKSNDGIHPKSYKDVSKHLK